MEAETTLLPINSNTTIISKEEGKDDGVTMDTDKLSYEIFSILESKFLFGYDDHKLSLSLNEVINKNTSSKTQRGKICILSIDGGGGGGMHGILPGKALSFLEQSLKNKSGDPNASISDYFDLAAGTGVGGLFAAMLFSTKHASAGDTWRFLVNNGLRLFRTPSSSKKNLLKCLFSDGDSNGAAMEKAIKETLGEDLTLKNTVKPLLIPCYDMLTSSPLVFSRADALEKESYDFKLWEVCRATWAEPGRVGPVEIRSVDKQTVCVGVDGGLVMSNPTAAAITHVLHNKQEFPFVRGLEDVMVLSLGCGLGPGSGSNEYWKVSKWGRKEWAKPIARIGSDGSADLVDHAVAMAFGDCRGSNYLRIQANRTSMMKCGPDADCDPNPQNVKSLLSVADEMLKQNNVESVLFGGKRIGDKTNMEMLESFAENLVLEHKTRSSRIAPTVAFKQPILNCNSKSQH